MKITIDKKGCVSGEPVSFFNYFAWPSVCTDENGVLYTVCSGMRVAHVCPFGKVLLYKSRNGGDTWSVPSVIYDTYLDDRDAGALYLGNGRILFNSFRHPAGIYENDYAECIINDSGKAGTGMIERYSALSEDKRVGGSFIKISDDFGETVSEEVKIPIQSPHGAVLLSDGRIIWLGKEMYSCGREKEEIIAAYISCDNGSTFSKVGECPLPDGFLWNQLHEPHCVELCDGRLMGFIRTHPPVGSDHSFTVFVTFSSDGGKTWSVPEKTGICGSPPHAHKLNDGRILLTYGRRIEPYGIRGRIITPDGIISDEEIVIDDAIDSDIGYPASAQLPDGRIVTVYYKKTKPGEGCRIMFTRFCIGD